MRYDADRMSGVHVLTVQLLFLVGHPAHNLRLRFIALAPAPRRVRCPRPGRPGPRKENPKATTPVSRAVRLAAKTGVVAGGALQSRTWSSLLADPGMQELIRNAPQAGRILRPICRMMALIPDPAILPPPPKRPRRTAPSAPEPDPAAPNPAEKPMRKRPLRTEARTRKPKWTYPGTEWRKWGGFWLPEPIRKPA